MKEPAAPANHEVVRTRGGALAMRSLEAGGITASRRGAAASRPSSSTSAQSRLAERLLASSTLVLFDVGLGAGSHALAARAASERAPAEAGRLQLVSFERDLGALRLALETPSAFGIDAEAADAARALLAHGRHDTARTTWRLEPGDVGEALARVAERADVVYWDPFSPRANPTLWTIAAFAALRRVAGPRCTLFTYSASTATRVALLLAGWAVGVGDPIGDKAQTTAAAAEPADLARPLDRAWLTRLARADVPLPPRRYSDRRGLRQPPRRSRFQDAPDPPGGGGRPQRHPRASRARRAPEGLQPDRWAAPREASAGEHKRTGARHPAAARSVAPGAGPFEGPGLLDLLDDAAVDADGGAVGGARGGARQVHDHVGDLGGGREAPEQRRRARRREELALHGLEADAARGGQLAHEGGRALRGQGPGSTQLTVTAVPRVRSARPRAIASCAVLVVP